jgi:hypothetical protein
MKNSKTFRHQGNANQNFIEIPSHPSHDDYPKYDKKQQILARKMKE